VLARYRGSVEREAFQRGVVAGRRREREARQASKGQEPRISLNWPAVEALRVCAADTSPNWEGAITVTSPHWEGAITVYPPGAPGLVMLIDAYLDGDLVAYGRGQAAKAIRDLANRWYQQPGLAEEADALDALADELTTDYDARDEE
jgi:hypothetical protein